MVNKVVAKKISFRFEPIGQDTFKSKLEGIREALRYLFPTANTPKLQSVSINMSNPQSPPVVEFSGDATELHMISADNKHALIIGVQGFDYITRDYVNYEKQKEIFLSVIRTIHSVLDFHYVSHISQHNINMFDVDGTSKAMHIKNDSPFNVLENNFETNWTCIGAATRQDYVLENGLLGMTVNSTVAHPRQSYAPQQEWNIWQMMGGIPVLEERKLLLTISVAHHQKEKQLGAQTAPNLVEFSIEDVQKKLDTVHKYVNSAYNSITKED